MSNLPFPIFVQNKPVDPDNKRAALAAVGQCRFYPSTCSNPSDYAEFQDICAKNKEQALVDTDTPETKDESKKLKKKYMKQGVAMASKYLRQTLQLDVSIISVQVVLEGKHILETDGCLVACMLDAGCAAIVVDGLNLAALDAAKVPRERIVAHFSSSEAATSDAIQAALSFASCISVELSNNSLETVDSTLSLVTEQSDTVDFQLTAPSSDIVAQIISQSKASVGLVDPSADLLGSSCIACMKQSDRQDGLYATVVCTRASEALGLEYSSKDSIIIALESGAGIYCSRSDGTTTSSENKAAQTLHRLDLDFHGDALRFTVTQSSGDDAKNGNGKPSTVTAWGTPTGIRHLEDTLKDRLQSAPEGSYTKRLFDDPDLLRDKLVEEAQELAEAEDFDEVAGELADVMYFALARATKAGVKMEDAVAELDRRTRKVTRRKGDSKAFRIAAGNAILGKK
ncbi:unnamed protein product [Cylindrotheca closterium]|uniref:phosphoribosyl-ATP diphosphatase n=1 Tax=Cylindrotheca closterium TaxID=2856 RepID=A0AAD2CWM5_9STRA|nr:unnamed protein product [Cylindrotheca closterium]